MRCFRYALQIKIPDCKVKKVKEALLIPSYLLLMPQDLTPYSAAANTFIPATNTFIILQVKRVVLKDVNPQSRLFLRIQVLRY